MLATIENVLAVPGMANAAAIPTAWVNALLGAADTHIKRWLKQNIELQPYVEYYNGDNNRDIVLKQLPVLMGQTKIAAGSNGAALPQATINVLSTKGFDPGPYTGSDQDLPSIAVQTGINTYAAVAYTGTTATSFTGCAGGTGTLNSTDKLNNVFSPLVFFDMGGYSGQGPSAFAPGTLLTLGSQYKVELDSGGKVSNRGTIRKMGGAVGAIVGFFPEYFYSGKLASYRLPTWPRGDGNIKVAYSAGYYPVPYDISFAVASIIAYMIRNQPAGALLASESLGAYSYSVLQQAVSGGIPELGSPINVLAQYRDTPW